MISKSREVLYMMADMKKNLKECNSQQRIFDCSWDSSGTRIGVYRSKIDWQEQRPSLIVYQSESFKSSRKGFILLWRYMRILVGNVATKCCDRPVKKRLGAVRGIDDPRQRI